MAERSFPRTRRRSPLSIDREETMSLPSLLERRLRVFGKHSLLLYERPIHLVRGEGVWVWDADGNRYLDAYNNVPHVGHYHPRVVEALCHQASILNTHTRYLDETVIRYAERLLETFDESLANVFFRLHRHRGE